MKKQFEVCLISSTGGHLTQIKEISNVIVENDIFFVTEKNETTKDLNKKNNVYFLRQQDRRDPFLILKIALNFIVSMYIFSKERPKIVITTGAGVVIPFCLIAKLFKSKIIYIESFAKIESPTITGRIIYKFADKFYVQWEDMLKYYPNAIYRGQIY